MLTPRKVFFHRVKVEEKFKLSVFKQIVDWVVALYIVIPALAFAIYYYHLWWFSPPVWFDFIPVVLVLSGLFLFTRVGGIRLYLEDADRIFLLPQKLWIGKIIRYGITYSLIVKLGQTLLVFGILSPLFKYYQLEYGKIVILVCFVFLLKVFFGIVGQLVSLRWQGWKLFVLDKLIFILGYSGFLYLAQVMLQKMIVAVISILLFILALFYLIRKRLRLKGTFLEDIVREKEESLKYIDLLLGFNGIEVKKPKRIRKRPFLFARSRSLFKKKTKAIALTEVAIKATLRSPKYVMQYFQIVAICIVVLLTIPQGLQILLWLVFSFLVPSFLTLYFQSVYIAEFIQLFKWDMHTRQKAIQKYLFYLSIPGFGLISLALNVHNFSSMGIILSLVLSIFWISFSSKMVANYFILRKG
ncbi:ABC-2 type transport system permease protein [Desulfonispora thiosulfatigenes DSM 11270]|uniref:ABC-2 type transport system permease protein n=1 Tax=Desulfonispora thiosulfatigenes DSM 11270 TaxID=656914 RepID=A0A1W1UHB4_DESTI|nr:ABC transporter permease [Desulfonispora thiosulfatigenes]SMB80422.1 ABC-2 type transport system permease protein [Desulfonispora thiosulfatigenes DSM 11270]